MPILKNPRHEIFAQERAMGRSIIESHRAAGYTGTSQAGSRLDGLPDVKARVAELQGGGAERVGITAERVLRELARISFYDVRAVVSWACEPGPGDRENGEEPADGAAKPGRQRLGLEGLDEASVAAISQITRLRNGALRLKLHDKVPALIVLARHLNLFAPRPEEQVPWFIAGEPIENLDKWVEKFKPMPTQPAVTQGGSPEEAPLESGEKSAPAATSQGGWLPRGRFDPP